MSNFMYLGPSNPIVQEYCEKWKMFNLEKRQFKRTRVFWGYVKDGKVVKGKTSSVG